MKKIYPIIFMMVFIKINAQMSDTFTTIEYNDNVSTQNNITKINLFNIDFNGEMIPINLIYSHNGVMVNETPSSIGVSWQLQNIGKITRIINDENDNKPSGWFNTPDQDYSTLETLETINCSVFPIGSSNITCPDIGGSYPGDDLSPDFFSFNTSKGMNFDFLFKKNTPPIPIILSNFKDYEINTNFSNFYHDNGHEHSVYEDVVFDIVDTNGNKYDFINGLDNPDPNRSFNGDHRNDYYLSSISNPSKTNEVLNITYKPTYFEKKVYFSLGYSDCPGGLDNNCDTIDYLNTNYYTISENRYDINQITTNNSVINFIYNGDYLVEIEIKDLLGNYISGYIFSYISNPKNIFLQKVQKYNNDKSELLTLFQFEYYDTNLGIDFSNPDRLCRDFFGYFNGTSIQTNLFPFQAGTMPAANLNPNLTFAKYYSLQKIINKYGGTKEFGYQLKTDLCDGCQGHAIYGGGLVINSVIAKSNSGNPKYTNYDYDDLDGNIVDMTDPKSHFTTSVDFQQYVWSSRLRLVNVQDRFDIQDSQIPIQRIGNFYKKITESVYDYLTMNFLSKTICEYKPNPEGIYLTPQLTKESFINSFNVLVKENDYIYSNSIVETIQSANFRCDTRNLAPSFAAIKKLSSKVSLPISINRNKLVEHREILNTNSGSHINQTYLSYVNTNSNLVRSKTEISSNGVNNIKQFFYPNDIEVSNEPNINILQINNRIDIPIKTETYRNAEKLSEEKTIYSNDGSTNNIFLPKYVFAKKGNDTNSTLERKITFDKYDTNSTLLQYTLENGTPVSIIWGYNRTQPIAKIVNKNYLSIPVNLITAAQTASNTTNGEASLLLALNAIRTNAALTNSMITTYTYIPLVGISTITDPKGNKTTYTYDSFGRLQNLKDKDNNILSEKDYNYEPQN
jgi:YD repeat-containing protein